MKTKLLCMMILATLLLTSCTMAVIGEVRGDYDKSPYMKPTPEEEAQSQMGVIAFGLGFLVIAILSLGKGLRAFIFSLIGTAICLCFALA